MSDVAALRAQIIAALHIAEDERHSEGERLRQIEELLAEALAGLDALPLEDADRVAALPATAAAIERIQSGQPGRYFEAELDGSPSERLIQTGTLAGS